MPRSRYHHAMGKWSVVLAVIVGCAQPRPKQVEQKPTDWWIEKEPATSKQGTEQPQDAGVSVAVAVTPDAAKPELAAPAQSDPASAPHGGKSVRDLLAEDGGSVVVDARIDTSYPPVTKPFYAMRAKAAVPGLKITVTPVGEPWVFWTLTIENTRDDEVTINWDRSSFVGRSGRSDGRLLRGETRKIDAARAQPSTTIPGRASIEQVVIPEQLIVIAEMISSRSTQEPMPPPNFVGARMVLAIERGATKQTWTAQFAPTSPGFYCPTRGMCVRDRADCSGKCQFVKKAWCQSNKCVASKKLCAELQKQIIADYPATPETACLELE